MTDDVTVTFFLQHTRKVDVRLPGRCKATWRSLTGRCKATWRVAGDDGRRVQRHRRARHHPPGEDPHSIYTRVCQLKKWRQLKLAHFLPLFLELEPFIRSSVILPPGFAPLYLSLKRPLFLKFRALFFS